MFAPPISTSFACPRHGSISCDAITICVLIGNTVHLCDRLYANKARGSGVLTAVPTSLGSGMHRYTYDLLNCFECASVWVEFLAVDGINMFSGNHYFSPDTKVEVITDNFRPLEYVLCINRSRVIL
jgi:hypothetical protein